MLSGGGRKRGVERGENGEEGGTEYLEGKHNCFIHVNFFVKAIIQRLAPITGVTTSTGLVRISRGEENQANLGSNGRVGTPLGRG